ncbi:alkene reductase [Microscilla marina]|uniref:GTN Reductase n=1 Tax=Microscilla marina ATCC 23134 TaxID=313606 RepID=A1ZT25_MICM2|nr:alkene reductase [Microscilla marina]EAY26415.1 GTN Reductase [Microscilla marina ATCC 23134]
MELLKPVQMGSLNLANRVFMAPLTRSRANNEELVPTDLHAEYYVQRASAGLIITEGTVISPQGTGYINVPGIYTEAQVEAWKKVTAAVHEKDGKIFMQIWHVGRMSHPHFQPEGKAPVAPSAINPNEEVFTPQGKTKTETPRALTKEEIKGIVQDFKNAAANAMKAGFDGVEIHSSNGYLIHQFFNNCSNLRTDEYGGNDENKTRFFFEVLDAVKEVVPEDRIGVRLNPMLHQMMGQKVDEQTAKTFEYIIKRLNNYNLAYLHLSRPFTELGKEDYFVQDVIGHFGKLYKGFLVSNAGYDGESGEQEIASQRTQAIAYGRPYIANPDLVERFANGWELTKPNQDTFYTPGKEGYTDYERYAVTAE